jgi:predicted GIY-YIG superfamily endonuclease
MKPGYLYIITNPSHVGWVKIGVTEDIQSRLHVYQTGDPQRQYKVEFYIKHPNVYKAEKDIKEMMHYFAKNIKNEWYECDLQIAIVRLQEQVECDLN